REGDALITICRRIDQGQFNRLLGLTRQNAAAIAQAVAGFRAAGIRNPFIQIPPGNPALEAQAREAGLVERSRPWVKFRHPLMKPSFPVTGVSVTVVDEFTDAILLGNVVARGFGMPSVMAGWLAAVVHQPEWRGYLAFDMGTPIAGALLHIRGSSAWLGAGAT